MKRPWPCWRICDAYMVKKSPSSYSAKPSIRACAGRGLYAAAMATGAATSTGGGRPPALRAPRPSRRLLPARPPPSAPTDAGAVAVGLFDGLSSYLAKIAVGPRCKQRRTRRFRFVPCSPPVKGGFRSEHKRYRLMNYASTNRRLCAALRLSRLSGAAVVGGALRFRLRRRARRGACAAA